MKAIRLAASVIAMLALLLCSGCFEEQSDHRLIFTGGKHFGERGFKGEDSVKIKGDFLLYQPYDKLQKGLKSPMILDFGQDNTIAVYAKCRIPGKDGTASEGWINMFDTAEHCYPSFIMDRFGLSFFNLGLRFHQDNNLERTSKEIRLKAAQALTIKTGLTAYEFESMDEEGLSELEEIYFVEHRRILEKLPVYYMNYTGALKLSDKNSPLLVIDATKKWNETVTRTNAQAFKNKIRESIASIPSLEKMNEEPFPAISRMEIKAIRESAAETRSFIFKDAMLAWFEKMGDRSAE